MTQRLGDSDVVAKNGGAGERLARWYEARRRVIETALTVGGAVAVVGALVGLFPYGDEIAGFGPMGDASAYWLAARSESPYQWQPGMAEFRYSPAFLWLIAPISWLPWELFAAVWVLLHVSVLWWFRAPWLLAFPPVTDDIIRGNISLFLAAMIVLAIRYPGLWAFGFLTKVTPGIGVAWQLGRRDWRGVLVAGLTTGLVVGLGLVIDRSLWREWWDSLFVGAEDINTVISLPIRVMVGSAIVVAAAVRQDSRLVPVGVAMAMPTLWLSSFAVLAALVPLSRFRRTYGDV